MLPLRVDELLDAVAARTSAPGGGAAAALTAALAAGLTAMAARFADPPAVQTADRADALRAEASRLADADVEAYGRYLAATRLPRDGDPHERQEAVRQALSEATDVPLAVADLATEVAALAADLARHGNPRLHGDAVAGAELAAAAASVAATLVAENLAGDPGDPRLARAAQLAEAARRRVS